jgi:hypothetical protein
MSSKYYSNLLYKYVFCCFYSIENEYEGLIEEDGVLTFVYDKETRTTQPIEVADAYEHIGVDDDREVCKGFFERPSNSVIH